MKSQNSISTFTKAKSKKKKMKCANSDRSLSVDPFFTRRDRTILETEKMDREYLTRFWRKSQKLTKERV